MASVGGWTHLHSRQGGTRSDAYIGSGGPGGRASRRAGAVFALTVDRPEPPVGGESPRLAASLIITVSDVARSAPFYGAVLGHLGYELVGSSERYQDWKRHDQDAPHELSIVEAGRRHAGVRHVRGAGGHHHHLAFCALDRGDVDRFFAEVLRPVAERGAARSRIRPASVRLAIAPRFSAIPMA